jgi:hypothetical protein
MVKSANCNLPPSTTLISFVGPHSANEMSKETEKWSTNRPHKKEKEVGVYQQLGYLTGTISWRDTNGNRHRSWTIVRKWGERRAAFPLMF